MENFADGLNCSELHFSSLGQNNPRVEKLMVRRLKSTFLGEENEQLL